MTLKAKLTFRGKPVFGSHGIGADFGSKGCQCPFLELLQQLLLGLSENLQYKGPIPDKQKNQLLITGIADGFIWI